jgi:hypothetical protein
MVSMQPTNQSYFADEESCFLRPAIKPYRKGSLMSIILKQSPIFAFLCQHSQLDTVLDDENFQGTVFAPGKEYCAKYYSYFDPSTIDHQRARELVLAAVLKAPMRQKDLFDEPPGDVPFDGCQTAVLPTMHRYSYLHAQLDPKNMLFPFRINGSLTIIRGDLQCTNGVLHILNGLIEPEASI